jgi:hypothetical protein
MCATYTCYQGLSENTCELVPYTYSFIIGLDNHAKCCIDKNVYKFITKLTHTPNKRVRGVDNKLMSAKGRCTGFWKIEDDDGIVHELLFPGTLYIPE